MAKSFPMKKTLPASNSSNEWADKPMSAKKSKTAQPQNMLTKKKRKPTPKAK